MVDEVRQDCPIMVELLFNITFGAIVGDMLGVMVGAVVVVHVDEREWDEFCCMEEDRT